MLKTNLKRGEFFSKVFVKASGLEWIEEWVLGRITEKDMKKKYLTRLLVERKNSSAVSGVEYDYTTGEEITIPTSSILRWTTVKSGPTLRKENGFWERMDMNYYSDIPIEDPDDY